MYIYIYNKKDLKNLRAYFFDKTYLDADLDSISWIKTTT